MKKIAMGANQAIEYFIHGILYITFYLGVTGDQAILNVFTVLVWAIIFMSIAVGLSDIDETDIERRKKNADINETHTVLLMVGLAVAMAYCGWFATAALYLVATLCSWSRTIVLNKRIAAQGEK